MISTEFDLGKGLQQSKALQLVLSKNVAGEPVSFIYDSGTGIAILRTRAFPAFDESEITESDLSREVNRLAEDYKIATTKLNDRKRLQDQRESDLNNKESKLADDQLDFDRNLRQLMNQRKQFESDLAKAGRMGLGAKIKSWFHTIR